MQEELGVDDSIHHSLRRRHWAVIAAGLCCAVSDLSAYHVHAVYVYNVEALFKGFYGASGKWLAAVLG